MARNELDREDLLREATALVQRVELAVTGQAGSIVVGFRRQGDGSIYLDADHVLQFNVRGELRRAFESGRLLKAEQGRLVELTRERTAADTTLWRRDLSHQEEAQLVTRMTDWLDGLIQALAADGYQVIGQAPADVDVVGRVRTWLTSLPRPLRIAKRPNAA